MRKSSSRRLFSNGQCPYYRRRQAAGGDGSDHDCCGAEEQSPTPGFSSTVWRPAPPLGGHLSAVATLLRRHTLARWSEAVDVPSDIVKRLSLSAITTGRTPVHVPMPTAINHRFRQHVAVERFELIGRTPDWLSCYDIGKPWSPIHHPCNGIRRHRPSRSLRRCERIAPCSTRFGVSSLLSAMRWGSHSTVRPFFRGNSERWSAPTPYMGNYCTGPNKLRYAARRRDYPFPA